MNRNINNYNKNSDTKKGGRGKLVFPVAERLKPQGVKEHNARAELALMFRSMRQKIFFKLVLIGAVVYGLLLAFIGALAFIGMKQAYAVLSVRNFHAKVLLFGLALSFGVLLIFLFYVLLVKLAVKRVVIEERKAEKCPKNGEKKEKAKPSPLEVEREKFIEGLKTEFVSIAAHQLRTPISAVKWIIRMLMDEDLGPLTKEQKDYLTKAYLSNERMVKLINDLLNVTRIEEGKFLSKQRKANLIETMDSAFSLWKGAAERKGLEFEFQKPKGKVPYAFIDVEKVSLVLQNLIDNALNYTLQGKITVKVEFVKPKNEFLISVTDTGIGIPNDQQDRVFTRFFRAGNAVKVETEGTGLGLYIAKSIVQAHGGRVYFESEEGRGTTFYFTLPAYS